jgi:hypothetical protein
MRHVQPAGFSEQCVVDAAAVNCGVTGSRVLRGYRVTGIRQVQGIDRVVDLPFRGLRRPEMSPEFTTY